MSASSRLRRAVKGSQGRARELGAPPTYTEHQFGHAERLLRHRELVRARERAPRLIVLGAAVGLAMAVITSLPVGLLVGAGLALGLFGLAFLPNGEQRVPWHEWRRSRRRLVAGLRELPREWTVLWDRRFDAAPTPVTIALGPTGIWLLWAPEPEWAGHDLSPILAQLTDEIGERVLAPSFAVHTYAIHTRTHINRVLALMVAGVPQAGPDQLRDWIERIDANTIQEPILAPS